MIHRRPVALAALLTLALPAAAQEASSEVFGPGPVPVDVFHPDVKRGDAPAPKARGGRIIVHLESMPANLNQVIENSAVTRWITYELHDTLLHQDWETWEWNPRLCTSWDMEDCVVLADGAAAKYGAAVVAIERDGLPTRNLLYGAVRETDAGYVVEPVSQASRLAETITVPKDDVAVVERGAAFTFYLREGVRWHDGHVFDADDVLFSWQSYTIPGVDSEKTRSLYGKLIWGEVARVPDAKKGGGIVRFAFEHQFYQSTEVIGEIPILPRHLYDLNDPDNRAADPKTHAALAAEHGPDYRPSDEERSKYINENPHNHDFVGLGAYRLTKWDPQYIEAKRFADYWDKDSPVYGGYLDTIRWRYIDDDNTAFQAALNGELDLMVRLKSEDYFGAATETEAFQKHLYKGYFYTGIYAYLSWNMRRPYLADPNVRRALAHAFDVDEFIDTAYFGLAKRVSGPPHYFSDAYDRSVEAPKYDPELAEEMLAEAGWYDRDGDGIIDKDGKPLVLEFLYPTGNSSSLKFGLRLQEALAKIGVKLELANLEWATCLDRIYTRDFDCIHLAWSPELESDPEQLWHSKWAPLGVRSSNHPGLADPEVDRLIEEIQRELDRDRRIEHWHAFHQRVASLDPYLFLLNTPRKFTLDKRFRGMQTFMIPPGYSLRRLYLPAGTPGTVAIESE